MLGEATRKQLLRAIEKSGLIEHRDALLAEARECIQLFYGKPESDLPTGISKVGGLPDLPDSIAWPDGSDREGKPSGKATFLAQFNLAELPLVNGFDIPRTGHLWLFVRNTDLIRMPTAIFYRDRSDEPLKQRADPSPPRRSGWRDLNNPGNSTALSFRLGVSLPFSSRKFERKFAKIDLGDLQENLTPGMDNYGPRVGIDGQMGGFSFPAEIDLCREMAFTELGHPDYASADYWSSIEEFEAAINQPIPFIRDPAKQEIHRNELRKRLAPAKWIFENNEKIQAIADSLELLCMFRPKSRIGLEFGDGMYTDFLMHRDALVRRDFSNVYCELPMLL